MIVNLFDPSGAHVTTIKIPDEPMLGIVVWHGLYFHLVNGRYVQATVWHHIG